MRVPEKAIQSVALYICRSKYIEREYLFVRIFQALSLAISMVICVSGSVLHTAIICGLSFCRSM